MTKQQLRSIYLQKRRELAEADVQERSGRIAELFFRDIDLSTVRFIHIFLPIAKNKEPDTWLIIHRLKTLYPRISIVLPKVNGLQEMEHYLFRFEGDLEMNAWGIPEPQGGEQIPPDKIDMVLIPLLAFDVNGNRVGYGKGFYDRFLAHCRPDTYRIGISLFEPVSVIDDVDSFDQRLHRCITPQALINF